MEEKNYRLDTDYGIWCSVDAAYVREERMQREDDLTPPEFWMWQKVEETDDLAIDADGRQLRPGADS